MLPVRVVTSCSLKGWDAYGKNFVRTFDEFWPPGIPLYVVSEDDLGDLAQGIYEPGRRPLYFFPLKPYSPLGKKFLDTYANVKWVHGDAGDKAAPRRMGGFKGWRPNAAQHCFRHDAYKFSKKVFAIEIAANAVSGGRLLWIDADVVTFAPVPEGLADLLLPHDYALSCLARIGYHSECGFVGYNLEHPATRAFITAFASLYATGEVFELLEWHDSFVFDWLRNKRQVPTYAIPHRSQSHPFINSELGKYLDHFKGGRKRQLRTQPLEQLVHRQLPYWTQK